MVIDQAGRLGNQIETFIQELEQMPAIKQAASGFSVPGGFFLNQMWSSSEPNAKPKNIDYSYVSDDYTETLDIEMVAGRDFGQATPDTFSVMLNETAAREYGWTPQEAVGKGIEQGASEFEIVGVMKDFHYESLHQEVQPMMFFTGVQRQNHVVAHINSTNVTNTLEAMRSTWDQFSDLPFNYSFLEDDLAEQYQEEAGWQLFLLVFQY